MVKKFLRADYRRYSKIGKNRKKLQVWRKPKGRDSKMRLRIRGRPLSPSVGYKKPRAEAGKVKGMFTKMIYSLSDISSIPAGTAGIISAKIGAKKRLEIIKQAQAQKLILLNVGGKHESR